MSQPSPTPTPASTSPAVAKVSLAAKLFQKAVAVAVWSKSPTGRKDLGALVAAATAVYTALHRLGV